MIEWVLPVLLYLWWGLGVYGITYTEKRKLIGDTHEKNPAKRLFILLTWPLWIAFNSMATFIEIVEGKIATWLFKKAFGGMFK